MLSFIHSLTDVEVLLLILVSVVGMAMLAPYIGKHLFRLPVNKARDDASFDAYKAVLAMAGVVLAFSLVQANNNLREDQDLVGKEAASLSTVDRILLRLGLPDSVAIRPFVATLGNSIVKDEWPALTRGDRSPATDAAYIAVSKRVRALTPADGRQQAMFAELLKALDDLSDYRETIIQDADLKLPDFFWVLTGGFLLLGFVLALLGEPSITRIASLGGTAAGIALLLAFVLIVDEPFKGQTSVSARPIIKALELNRRRA